MAGTGSGAIVAAGMLVPPSRIVAPAARWCDGRPAPSTPPSVTEGYWFLPTARGRGLATRAERLRLLKEPENLPPNASPSAAGSGETVVLAGHSEVDGRTIDHVVFTWPPAD
jgi:hypothetical protein